MKKQLLISLFVSGVIIIAGCSKDDSPTPPTEETGTISGKITNSINNQAIAGVKVKFKNVSALTDNSGSYTLSNLAAGTDSLVVYEPGYQTKTVKNVTVTKGNTTTINASTTLIAWVTKSTDNTANAALPLSLNPSIKGVALTNGDVIGCFYDSLGTPACCGFTALSAGNTVAVPVTIWGDDSFTSDKKEGMKSGETIKWKVKRQSDGKVFDATATYKSGVSVYQINGIYEISGFSIIAD